MPTGSILDEMGYVPFSKAGAELFFDVVGRAYERTSLIVATNLPFEQWIPSVGQRTTDGRPVGSFDPSVHILEANGQSYRLADAKSRLKKK